MLNRNARYGQIIFFFYSLVWMILIYFLSSLPGDTLGPGQITLNLVKKAGHFVLYGVLAALYLYAMKRREASPGTGAVPYTLSLLFALIYAVSDEYHQSFVPGRHASAVDVFIDACGAVTMLGTLYGRRARIQAGLEGNS